MAEYRITYRTMHGRVEVHAAHVDVDDDVLGPTIAYHKTLHEAKAWVKQWAADEHYPPTWDETPGKDGPKRGVVHTIVSERSQ